MPINANYVIGAFLMLLLGAALITPLATSVSQYSNTTAGAPGANVTGASGTLTALLTLVFVIILLVTGFSYIKFRQG